MVTLVERHSRFTAVVKVPNKDTAVVVAALSRHVKRALGQAEGNKSKAAELLGIHRRLLYEKLRQYSIG
jgi:DNA-binding NtrC family response regulator